MSARCSPASNKRSPCIKVDHGGSIRILASTGIRTRKRNTFWPTSSLRASAQRTNETAITEPTAADLGLMRTKRKPQQKKRLSYKLHGQKIFNLRPAETTTMAATLSTCAGQNRRRAPKASRAVSLFIAPNA